MIRKSVFKTKTCEKHICTHGPYQFKHFVTQVPPSPLGADDAEDKFVVVSAEDCKPTGDREEVFKNLQADLLRQIRVSRNFNPFFILLFSKLLFPL